MFYNFLTSRFVFSVLPFLRVDGIGVPFARSCEQGFRVVRLM